MKRRDDMKTLMDPLALLTCCIMVCLASVPANASGTSGGLTLTLPVGVRAAGMGAAYTVSSGDASGLHYNPGVLPLLEQGSISAFYQSGLAEDNLVGFDVARALGRGVMGASLLYYSTGDIEIVSSSGEARYLDGQSDFVGAVSYGLLFSNRVTLGITVKAIRSTLVEEFTAGAIACDLGTVIELYGKHLMAGVAVRNIGQGLRYSEETDNLPWVFGVGLLYTGSLLSNQLALSVDMVRQQEMDSREHLGVEYKLSNVLAIRAGYKFGYEHEGLTFGLGVELGRFELGQAFGMNSEFSNVSVTQICYRF